MRGIVPPQKVTRHSKSEAELNASTLAVRFKFFSGPLQTFLWDGCETKKMNCKAHDEQRNAFCDLCVICG
jgi:hypothetical protein